VLSQTILLDGTFYCQNNKRIGYEGDDLEKVLKLTNANKEYASRAKILIQPRKVTEYSLDFK
jgi:hypothetical protein